MSHHIITCVALLELDINNCVRQGYDGAASVSGHVSGVQTRIREKASTAIYVHCASHCLNLVFNTSSQLPAVRNMFATLSDFINFFNESPKRHAVLDMLGHAFDILWHEIHSTGWFYPAFCRTLLWCSFWLTRDRWRCEYGCKKKVKALSLLSSVSSSSFLVSLSAAKKVMSLTYMLSTCLQSPMLDLSDGTEMSCSIIEHFQRWWLRLSPISQFDRIQSTLNLIYELVGK